MNRKKIIASNQKTKDYESKEDYAAYKKSKKLIKDYAFTLLVLSYFSISLILRIINRSFITNAILQKTLTNLSCSLFILGIFTLGIKYIFEKLVPTNI